MLCGMLCRAIVEGEIFPSSTERTREPDAAAPAPGDIPRLLRQNEKAMALRKYDFPIYCYSIDTAGKIRI
jgi:hypothetical protein